LVDGRKRPILVVLQESSSHYSAMKSRLLEKYRVLRLGAPSQKPTDSEEVSVAEPYGAFYEDMGLTLDEVNQGAFYFQETWIEVDEASTASSSNGKKFERIALNIPKALGGVLLKEIPFVFLNPGNTKPKPEKPTLLDLTVLNLSHWRSSADIEHGLHFTALPQPWASGFGFNKEKRLYIGSGVAWVTDEPNAKAGMLEFRGTGLAAIRENMDRKEKQMAALGARLIEEQPKPGAAEAFETVRLRQSGDGSVLARISLSTSKGLTKTLEYIALFKGKTSKVKTLLNLDFGTEGMNPDLLKALMEQVQGGLMSWDTYVHNVRRGELYKDNWTQEEEADAIIAGPPGRSMDNLLQPAPEVQAPAQESSADPEEDA